MMTGYLPHAVGDSRRAPRRYEILPRAGGWSISLNGACTRPFADRAAAERIARQLQKQANGLNHTDYAAPRCGERSSAEDFE